MQDGTLYYTPIDPPARPFKRGDAVDTLDRHGKPMERTTVVRAGRKVVHTSCGRAWNQSGEYFSDGRGWPFPTIRLVE